MILLRNLWVYLVGLVLTVLYAGRIAFFSYVRPSRAKRYCDRTPRVWSQGILWAAGVDVELVGTENIHPEAAQILVANHVSWFDVWAIAATLPRVYHFVAKKELARIPLFGRAWITCEHIAIDRSNLNAAVASLDEAAEKIRRDHATIVMFPEGTRSATGRLQRFKKGAFVLAIKAGAPVVPVAITGSREVMPKGGWIVRPGHIQIRFGKPISVDGVDVRDRDVLVDRAWEAVSGLLEGESQSISEERET